jgi:hypothetical protein
VQGSWVVKQSVGSTACLLGNALTMKYVQGKDNLEVSRKFPGLLRYLQHGPLVPLLMLPPRGKGGESVCTESY